MTTTKHTPGPWAVDEFTAKVNGRMRRGIIQENGELWIANLPSEVENAEADASLIAAAPELLRLLVDIATHLSGGPLHPDGMIFEEDEAALAVIREAIAKARGV